MKILPILSLLFCFLLSSCGIREREEALEQREKEINQKEQSLLLLQKQLQLKEEDLLHREKVLDSTRLLARDSSVMNPKLLGKWAATMRCTATTCEGSAVGDVKNEQWDISYQDKNVIVRAMADGKLVRTYTGGFMDNSLQLTAQQEENTPPTKMTVQLNFRSDTELEGERKITRANNCQIVYALSLSKQ